MITFAFEKRLEKFRSVGYKNLGKVVYGGNGEDGVLADVGVSMLQTRSGRRKKRLNQFRFPKLAQEPQGVASYVLIRML